jgi:hypothetical protein
MFQYKKILPLAMAALALASCKKDQDPLIVIPASAGSQIQLNGIIAAEPGSSAGNSVFVDFSGNKQTAVARAGWDLGFFCGADFRVIINNTTTASAKQISKTDLSTVTVADTVGMNGLALGFDAGAFNFVDNIFGDLTKTVIPPVSSIDAENKVIIINRGTGGSTPSRDWYKLRILRTAAGYRLQYAKLSATGFATIDVDKDADYNFKYVSFDAGTVNAEPVKNQWDIKWSYTLYQTSFGADMIPFAFSDFISINARAGVQAAEVLTSTVSYDNYTSANIAGTSFSSATDVIAGKWRSTNPATGVRTDRFYVVKDPSGNYYKIKFLTMGAGDGGTRGKPEFKYTLVK